MEQKTRKESMSSRPILQGRVGKIIPASLDFHHVSCHSLLPCSGGERKAKEWRNPPGCSFPLPCAWTRALGLGMGTGAAQRAQGRTKKLYAHSSEDSGQNIQPDGNRRREGRWWRTINIVNFSAYGSSMARKQELQVGGITSEKTFLLVSWLACPLFLASIFRSRLSSSHGF